MNRVAVAQELVRLAKELTSATEHESWVQSEITDEEDRRAEKQSQERRKAVEADLDKVRSELENQAARLKTIISDLEKKIDYNPKRDGQDDNVEAILNQLKTLDGFLDRQTATSIRKLASTIKEISVSL
jgi:predicted ribosome quality control (RQC) complex YloA/Tae2 family protein